MFKFLSNLINKFRSESTSIPQTDHPVALPLDSEDELNNEFINEDEIDFSIFKDESPEFKEQLLKGAIADSVEFDHNGDAEVNIGIDIFRLARIAAELNPEPLTPEEIKAREQKQIETEKEIEAIEREGEVIHLSGKIRLLVVSLAQSYLDNYPTHIVKRKELIYESHECIINAADDIFKDAATEAFKDMFRGDLRLRGDIVPISRRILRELRDNRMTFDIQKHFMEAYLSFFLNYRPYWEDKISRLKKANAITHRRQCLIERIDEFSALMKTEGIDDFTEILQDYRQFNLDQIDVLTNNNSKN